MDLKGSLSTFILITGGKVQSTRYKYSRWVGFGVRCYLHHRLRIPQLLIFTQNLSTFIISAKSNRLPPSLLSPGGQNNRFAMWPDDKTHWLLCFTGLPCRPLPNRLLRHRDKQKFVFLTNNFTLTALTIARLLKYRWRTEILFKWIKQYLRIKTFFGTSENAVKTQICIAVSIYVLVAIVKKELNIKLSLSEILQILSIVLFEKVHITLILTKSVWQNENARLHNQLSLFNL